jgi:hypothetical protein
VESLVVVAVVQLFCPEFLAVAVWLVAVLAVRGRLRQAPLAEQVYLLAVLEFLAVLVAVAEVVVDLLALAETEPLAQPP